MYQKGDRFDHRSPFDHFIHDKYLLKFFSFLLFLFLSHRMEQLICRYLLYPVAWLLGTGNHQETLVVAELIGTKTFLNEFIAYKQLAEYKAAGQIEVKIR